MIDSIPETINHQEPERNLFRRKITARRTILNWSYDCP